MSIIEKIRRHGLRGSMRIAIALINNKSGYMHWRVRNAPVYANPTSDELASIERDLLALGITLHDYAPPARLSLTTDFSNAVKATSKELQLQIS